MSKPHLVLVHGAYHRAWHLKLLEEELQKAGFKVSNIDLPSCGEDAVEDDAMTADTEAIKAAIEKAASESDSVVPVFHSYSGIPGSDAAAELSDATRKKILRLVYLAAFAMPKGSGLTPPGGPLAPWASETSNPKFRYVPDPIPCFYHDVEPGLAEEAAKHCVQAAYSAFDSPSKHTGWELFPRTYIFCKDDRAARPDLVKTMFDIMSEEQRIGWEFEYIEGSHSPFLSRPVELARLLRRIAGEAV